MLKSINLIRKSFKILFPYYHIYLKRTFTVLLVLLLSACGGSGDDTISIEPTSQPAFVVVEASSNHYVTVNFSKPATKSIEVPGTFAISDMNGNSLAITDSSLSDDGLQVILTTDAQEPQLYELIQSDNLSASLSISNFFISKAMAAQSSGTFIGSTQPEPVLLTAISLSNTSLLLTFDEKMTSLAETIEFYRIVDNDDGTPSRDVADVTITDAALGEGATTVILTTSPQDNIEFSIKVTNITSAAGNKLIHPSLNTSTFFGIAPIDVDKPKLINVVSPDPTTIILTFNEPLADNADDPANFSVYSCVIEQEPCLLENQIALVVTDASLNQHNTQIVLTTLPQESGVAYTVVVSNVEDIRGNIIDDTANSSITTYNGEANPVLELPRVLGAISTKNNKVVVSFSKSMSSSVENPEYYEIVQETINSEVGSLNVISASYLGNERSAVELTTSSQNELTYRVTVVNVQDTFGQSIDTRFTNGGLFQANSVIFAGKPPSIIYACNIDAFGGLAGTMCSNNSDCWDPAYDETTSPEPEGLCEIVETDFVDSDGDGITDDKELRGYTIVIHFANGRTEERVVSSDPFSADTDGDGVSDLEEIQYGSNPRDADTDSDALSDVTELNVIFSSPYNADTDGDGLEDGLEYYTLQTSPIHADTDGDQLDDNNELFVSYRDPRMADLPELAIETGTMYVSLNEVYTYTDSMGEETSTESSSSAVIARNNLSETLTIDETVSESLNTGGFRVTVKGGLSESDTGGGAPLALLNGFVWAQGEGYGEFSNNTITSSGTDTTTARETQQILEDSYAKGLILSSGAEVVRQVESATLNVEVNLVNQGNMAFSVSDVEVTVLRMRPGTRRMEPITTMLAQAGAGVVYELGPFNNTIGPLVFSAIDLPITVAEELLRNPAGIAFKVSNYRITDEYDREYTYTNQNVQDRTVGLTIDYGYEGVKRHLMAASTMFDMKPASSTYQQAIGGFDAKGKPTGIPLIYLLENQLNWDKNPTVSDAIIAGTNRTANTAAMGDDVQRIVKGTRGLGIGTIIIEAGNNGVIDSIIPDGSSNRPSVTKGFDVSRTCGTNAPLIFQGQKACSTPSIDDQGVPQYAPECDCLGDEDCPIEYQTPINSNAQCNGPSVITRVGGYANKPGSYRWVALTNTELPTGADVEQLVMKPGENFKLAFVQDLDEDGLFARTEFLLGSTDSPLNQEDNVQFGDTYADYGAIAGCEGQVLPDFCGEEVNQAIPYALADSRDSDRDGIDDAVEYTEGWDVTPAGQARRLVYSTAFLRDSDGDGLTDWQERDIRFTCAQQFYSAGENRRVDGDYAIAPYVQGDYVFNPYTIVGYPDGYQNELFIIPFADVISALPTGDQYDDFVTLKVDFVDANSPLYFTKIAPYCRLDRNDPANAGEYLSESVGLDPQSVDTDGDGVEDGAEVMGYKVTEAIVANIDFALQTAQNFAAYGDDILVREFSVTIATDDVLILPGKDGELNYENYVLDFPTLMKKREGIVIRSNPLNADTDGDNLFDGSELALGTNPIDPNDAKALLDSDQDGVFDIDESRGISIIVNGASIHVRSNPTRSDSDGDGLPDFVEYQVGSNPSNYDTDADGLSDYDEFSAAQFAQYAGYVDLFEGFDLDGTSSMHYGTKLNYSDSDGDSLSDKEELDGYTLFVPIQTLAQTNPRMADTDGDGLSDSAELAGNIKTNPTLFDTDGDGASDGVERQMGSLSNPLEWDVQIVLTIQSIWYEGTEPGDDHADWQWSINLQKSNQTAPGEVLESHYTYFKANSWLLAPDNDAKWTNRWILWGALGGSGQTEGCPLQDAQGNRPCFPNTIAGYESYAAEWGYDIASSFAVQKNDGSQFMRYPNVSRTILLKENDLFTLSGYVNEVDAIVDLAPDSSKCNMRFNKTYTTQDFRSNGTVIADEFDMQDDTCASIITYTISTER
jgi:hypothetical protein